MEAIDHDLYLELIDATWEHRIIWEETKEPLADIANTPFGQLKHFYEKGEYRDYQAQRPRNNPICTP